jgi:hypothetical protein
MLDTLQQRRFAVARSSVSYRRALRETQADHSLALDVAKLIGSAVVMGALLFVLAAAGRPTMVLAGAIFGITWVALLVGVIRERTGPLVHRLAIVKSTWTSMAGGSAEAMRVGRTVTLVHDNGSEETYGAPDTAAGIVDEGEIGVAITRRRSLVRFISIES